MTERELRAQDARLTELLDRMESPDASGNELSATRRELEEYIAEIRVLPPASSAGAVLGLTATPKE